MWTKEEDREEIGGVITAGYLGTWPDIAEIQRDQRKDIGDVKRLGRPVSPRPASHNRYSVLHEQNKMDSDQHTKKEVRWTFKPLREV